MPVRAIGSRLWWGLPLLIVLLWGTGVLLVPHIPGLPEAPQTTVVGLPLTKYVRDCASFLTVGCLLVAALQPALAPRILRAAATWAIVWLLASAGFAALTVSDVLAKPLQAIITDANARQFTGQTYTGRVLLAQVIACCLVLALVGLLAITHRFLAVAIALALALAAAAIPALLGHGGLSGGHVVATMSLAVHFASVACWVGGLAVIAWLTAASGANLVLIRRFSTVALACVIIAAESGLLNGSVRLTTPAAFVATAYGSLLLLKVAVLAVLVGYGWHQRQVVIPGIAAGDRGKPLLVLAAGEAGLMAVAIAAAIGMSRVGPPVTTVSVAYFTPVATTMLAIGLPAAAYTLTHQPNWLHWPSRLPEIPAVLLCILAFESAVVQSSSTSSAQAAVIATSIALAACGWLWTLSWDGQRRLTSLALVAIGWPIVLAIGNVVTGSSSWPQVALASALAEGIIVLVARRSMQRPRISSSSQIGIDVHQ